MNKIIQKCVLFLAVPCILLATGYGALMYYYKMNIPYGTWVNDIYCTGMSYEEVAEKLLEQDQTVLAIDVIDKEGNVVTGINDDDYLYISYYDHDVLQGTSLSNELDSSFDEVSLSKNNITFDDVSFFASIENLMSNFITETETVVIVQPSEVSTASIIFQGIFNIGLMPVNFFLGVLNFEVFGINIGAFVSALLTLAIVIIIVRIIFSGGNGKGKE